MPDDTPSRAASEKRWDRIRGEAATAAVTAERDRRHGLSLKVEAWIVATFSSVRKLTPAQQQSLWDLVEGDREPIGPPTETEPGETPLPD